MSNKLWLSGVAVVLLLWAVIVVVVGGVSRRPLDIVCDGRLLSGFFFFLCGWTGGWLSPRAAGWPVKSSVTNH